MADAEGPRAEIRKEQVAKIIVEASVVSTKFAAQQAGCDERTVNRYIAKAKEDPALAAEVQKQYRELGDWTSEAKKTLRAITGFLYRAAQELDTKNPKNIHAMTGSFKLLSEAISNYEMIQAKLDRETSGVVRN